MKGFYYVILFVFILTSEQVIYAQCPPPGFPQPGNTCPTAPILCENLDGYCATINNNNTTQTFPGCPGWQLNNDEWFAFYAGTTTISIQITPSNCSPGTQQGLQGGIYTGCGNPWTSMDLQCSCTENPFVLSSTNFVVGQIYWIVLDGCAGNVCDYSVDVLEGSTVGAPPNNPGPVNAPVTACAGTTTPVSITPPLGATIYNWTVTPAGMGTVTGSGPNVNINWNANASGQAQVCVTVANACYPNNTPSCTTVDVIPKPTATISGSGVLCEGVNTPVDLTVNFTGQAPWQFVYTINGVPQPAIQTSTNPYIIQATQPGTYAIQSVSSVNGGCVGTVSGSSVITQTNINVTANVTGAQCGQSNGGINLSVSAGDPPYTFLWSPGGQTTEDLSNIPPGSYTVTVTDEDGCTKVFTATVPDNIIALNVTGVVTANTTCNGGNGSIDVSVSPSGTYTYLWSNSATTQDISNLPAGTYTVTVTSGVTCTGTASFTVADQPNTPVITSTVVGTTCELSNGSINMSVTGGVTPYTIIWSGSQTTEDLSNIPAGTYDVTVTGANGCSSTASINVPNTNPPFTINANIVANTTCTGGNGSITLNVTPAGTYTYLWSTNATTPSITNQPPGTYDVTVSAGGACTQTASFTIPDQPNTPTINPNVLQSTCDLSNGSISLSVSGGVPPYTYLWSTNATTPNLSNIPAGSYDVTVTGANGCSSTASINVGNNNPPINVNANIVANTTCNGGNGSITLIVTPPNTYTYLWSTNATTPNLNNLPPGTYDVTVSAGGTCTQTASFTVPDQPNLPNITPNIIPSTCDLNNGAVSLSVSGGVGPFTYLWSTNATTPNLNNIPAGGYDVTVTGANGCSNVANINVGNFNPPININANVIANTSCSSNGNGSIFLSVTPPNNAYTYMWSNNATTPNISGLLPGTYVVTVSAGGSCIETQAFVVPDDPNAPELSFTFVPSTCGLSNGSINLSVFGGVPPYTYLWSNNQTTQDISNLVEDIYSVTVTGANGCTATEGVVIPNEIIPITIDANVTPKTSCLVNNGAISLSLTPNNLSILWSNNSTSPNLNNLAPGTYTVTVSAGGSCTEVASFTIDDATEIPELVVDVTPAYCSLPNGSIDLDVLSGAEPFKYKWLNGPVTQDQFNLPAGNYTVTVTTALGCTATTVVGVPNNDLPIDIQGVVSDNVSCTAPNGFIDIDVSPAGNNYTFLWSNGKKTEDINNLPAGIYTVVVTLGSCDVFATFEVLDNALSPNLSVTAIPATCNQANGAANATVSGGSSPYTYLWSNTAKTEDINNVPPGTYTITVTDFFGCSSTASVTIPNNNIALNISGITAENTSCTVANGGINITVSPAGSYTYLWSNAAGAEDLNNLPAGPYSVTVSAGGSCSATAAFTVTNNTTDPVIAPVVTPAICGASNGAIDLTISGAAGPYSFNWLNMGSTEDLSNILSGNYSVTVTALNGCTADTTLNVPNNSSTFSLSGVAAPLNNCTSDNGAVNLTVTPAGTYTYLWSTTAVTEDISNLPAGTYSVSVTETGNCIATASFIVNDERTYPSTTQVVAPEICGLLNGSVDISVTGGATPYSYVWTGGATTEDLNGIADGTYDVTVTGSNGCTTTATANVPENSVTFTIDGTPVPNTSCVGSNGSVDITLTPAAPGSGLGGYTYLWSNNMSTQDLVAVAADNYTVTVSAGGTCTATASFSVANNSEAPSIFESITPAFCGQNSGSINLTVGSGIAPYTYLWSNNAVTEDLANLSSGNFSVTVTSANGCVSSEAYVVAENVIIPSISGATIPNTSCISNNGSITLSVSPVLTYTYLWSGNQTSPDISNLPPGVYSVTVSGGGGCTASSSFTVDNDILAVTLDGTPVNVLCFGDKTGSIDLNVNSGTQPFLYNWSPAVPGNPQDPSNLSAGNYTVTVTDAQGCTATIAFPVTQPASALQMSCVQSKNVSFPGAADGAGTVSLSGGEPPYDVVWSPGGTQSNVLPGNFPIINLGVGSYAVSATDANGCVANCDFAVELVNCETAVGTMSANQLSLCGGGCLTAFYNPTGQFLDPNDVFQFILHQGSSNVIVNEIARSNQPSFCFDPATMSFGVTYYISAVAGNDDGTGNVQLFDFCTEIAPGTPIVFREKPVAGLTPPAIINCIVKQVDITGSSNLAGSAYTWNTTTGLIIGSATQPTVTAGAKGTYTLIVSLNGCADTVSTQVQDITNSPQANILASPDDVLDCTISEIILSGTIEGTVAANVIWIGNGVVYPGYTVLPINAPGTYEFIILDTLSFCSDTALIQIDENLAYPPLFFNPPGFLTCTNSVTTLTGGSPLPGIQYTWVTVNGTDTTVVGTGTSVNITVPGAYILIGVDPTNNCTNSLSGTVNSDLVPPVADAGPAFSIDCFGETGYLDGNASFGGPGLQFLWTTSNGQLVAGINTPTPEINEPGTYVLIVTNPGNGCTDSDEVVIPPDEPIATAVINQPPCFGDKGSVEITQVEGAKPPIRYSIDGGMQFTTKNLFTNLTPGPYTILIVDAYGCSTTAQVMVEEGDVVDISLEPKVVIKLGESYQINTQINIPLDEIGIITWKPGTGLSCDTCLNPLATPTTSTLYRLTVANKEGCEDTAPLLLAVDKQVDVYVPNIFSPEGDGKNDLFTIYADPDGVNNIKSFQIFSRWGEMVYESYDFPPNSTTIGWDGKHRGQELNPGVFVWYAVLEFADGTEVLFKGDVTVKR